MNKAMVKSYARAFVVAVATAITMGKTDWKDIVASAVIAVLAPVARALDPNDSAFGRGA